MDDLLSTMLLTKGGYTAHMLPTQMT